MAKAKKSKSGGKSKKHKHGGKGKKGKSKGKGKKHRSGRKEKEKDELEEQEEKTGSKGSKHKAGGKGKKKKHGSKGKKGKTKSKGSRHKSGSKGKKPKRGSKGKKGKHGSKGKKDKHGGKGKKGKHGGKGKKGKPGGKGKKGSKDGILSVKKSKSSTPDRASSSALGRASAASSESLFRPLNRKPFSPLVLPADRQLTTVRRPTTIYIWNWDNVWFFPTGVVAVLLVVLGMVLMSLNVQEADELQAEEAMNATYARNVTTAAGVVATRTRRSRTDYSEATSAEMFTMRRRRVRAKNPNSAKPSFPGRTSTSKTWFEPAGSSEDGDSAVVIVRGEAEEDPVESDITQVSDAKTQAWLDAPKKGSQKNESTDIAISDSSDDIERR